MIPGDCDNLGFIVDHREAHLVKSSSNRIMIRRKEYRKCGEDFIPPELSPVTSDAVSGSGGCAATAERLDLFSTRPRREEWMNDHHRSRPSCAISPWCVICSEKWLGEMQVGFEEIEFIEVVSLDTTCGEVQEAESYCVPLGWSHWSVLMRGTQRGTRQDSIYGSLDSLPV
ncbi:hypothetical protein AFUB_021630 [Aspergillus fumigatus A1163]|uniref:Uncharacterized protein n=1 Tax=Aspergillus fumigatus (strain CBS 144.89 / FGSC A1163 / CEA10) TaxID=451804 RepID=B0XV47_ASPFC|nr:hypothetical protein AFUB_021630 [Aspergillus fumigatus A1163]